MIEHSTELNALATALAKAQAAVRGATRDSLNPHFRSKYADLASVWEACREALTQNGLSVVQLPGYTDGVATLDTILLHSSGQWIGGTAGAPLPKADAQGVGSALTYLRRYALAAVAGVAPEDDDAEGAVGRAPLAKAEQPLSEKPKALERAEPMPWDGKQQTPPPAPHPIKVETPAEWKRVWPFGSLKGRALHTLTSEELVAQRKWAEKSGKGLDLVDSMDDILASRQGT